MPLLLSREETQPLLDLPKAIELTEAAYRDQAEGQVTAHAPYHIHVQGKQALRVVSGALIKSRRVGIRLGPNVQLSGGDRMYALLFDSESGELLSFMGYPFGTMRTAATIAAAARARTRTRSAFSASAVTRSVSFAASRQCEKLRVSLFPAATSSGAKLFASAGRRICKSTSSPPTDRSRR